MGELPKQQYMHPLQLDASFFLNSLGAYQSFNQIDENLCKTLENIVEAIERFLDQALTPIVSTKQTQLVAIDEINKIRRIYHCTECKQDLGKNQEQAIIHLAEGHRTIPPASSERRSRNKDKKEIAKHSGNALAKLPKKCKSLFNYDIQNFFTENIQISEKLKQIPEYDTIHKELLKQISPLFPDKSIKLYNFGSRISGIGTRNSDLDIFIDIGNTFNNFENNASPTTVQNLKTVKNALRANKKSWPNVNAIEHARVPIIKVLNASTNIECDIGFSNSLGYCNTKLMHYIFELQPIARRLCIFMKKWLERSKLNDKLSTYSMELMVIFFLQIKKLLPPIEHVQKNLNSNVGPWIATYVEKSSTDLNIDVVNCNAENFIKILSEFFTYYAEFKFNIYAVCPYLGELIKIKEVEDKMPKHYTKYVEENEANKTDPKVSFGLQQDRCMVVQDPIQLNHNVTKGVRVTCLFIIQDFFKQSLECCGVLK